MYSVTRFLTSIFCMNQTYLIFWWTSKILWNLREMCLFSFFLFYAIVSLFLLCFLMTCFVLNLLFIFLCLFYPPLLPYPPPPLLPPFSNLCGHWSPCEAVSANFLCEHVWKYRLCILYIYLGYIGIL